MLEAPSDAITDFLHHRNDGERALGRGIEAGRVDLLAIEQVFQATDHQLALAVNACIQLTIDTHQALATVQGATAVDVQRHLPNDGTQQVGGGLTVEVTANALASQYAMPLPGIGMNVTHAAQPATGVHVQVAGTQVLCGGIWVCHHREGGVVPQVSTRRELCAVHRAIKAITGLQTQIAIGEQRRIGVYARHIVGLDPRQTAAAGRTGCAERLGVSLTVDDISTAGSQHQIADAVEVGALTHTHLGVALEHIDAGFGTGNADHTATVEFDPVIAINTVEGLNFQFFRVAPIAVDTQQYVVADQTAGIQGDRTEAARSRRIDHTTGAGLHVIGACLGFADVGTSALAVAAAVDARAVQQPGTGGQVDVVLRMGTAHAKECRTAAVDKAVEARLLQRTEGQAAHLHGITEHTTCPEAGQGRTTVGGFANGCRTADQATLTRAGNGLVVLTAKCVDLHRAQVALKQTRHFGQCLRLRQCLRHGGTQRQHADQPAIGGGALTHIGFRQEGPAAPVSTGKTAAGTGAQQRLTVRARGGHGGVGRDAHTTGQALRMHGRTVLLALTQHAAAQLTGGG